MTSYNDGPAAPGLSSPENLPEGDAFARLASSLPFSGSETDRAGATGAFSSLMTSRQLNALVGAVLTRADALETVLARAIWHPNGFYKTPLFNRTRQDVEVRMHIWPAASPELSESVHDHPWDSASLVCAGALRNETWDIIDGQDFFHHGFRTDWPGDARYTAMGRCALARTSVETIHAGKHYFIPGGQLHTTRAEESAQADASISLFLRGPFLRTASSLVSTHEKLRYDHIQTKALPMARSACLAALDRVYATLSNLTG